jgi:GNAT superfamily N-acetyltransferase
VEPPQPKFRVANPEDAAALGALIAVSVRGLGAADYAPEQVESALEHGMFGVDTQLLLDGTYFVAEVDAQIVGGGGWSRRPTLYGSDAARGGAPERFLDPTREPARIRAFFVHPAWARRGIGTALLRRCETAAQAAGFRRLELMATLPGERLYLAGGYQGVERVDVQLPNGVCCPCVRMEKCLRFTP